MRHDLPSVNMAVNYVYTINLRKEELIMNYISKKSNLVISIILFAVSAVSFCYGIYMINYSVDYVQTYTEISTIAFDNAAQYVISASYPYIGFAIVIFIGGFIIFSLRKVPVNIHINETSRTDEDTDKEPANDLEEDTDLHPENNPYFIPDVSEQITGEFELHEPAEKCEPEPEPAAISAAPEAPQSEPVKAVEPEKITEPPKAAEPETDRADSDNIHTKIMSDSWLKDIFKENK